MGGCKIFRLLNWHAEARRAKGMVPGTFGRLILDTCGLVSLSLLSLSGLVEFLARDDAGYGATQLPQPVASGLKRLTDGR